MSTAEVGDPAAAIPQWIQQGNSDLNSWMITSHDIVGSVTMAYPPQARHRPCIRPQSGARLQPSLKFSIACLRPSILCDLEVAAIEALVQYPLPRTTSNVVTSLNRTVYTIGASRCAALGTDLRPRSDPAGSRSSPHWHKTFDKTPYRHLLHRRIKPQGLLRFVGT